MEKGYIIEYKEAGRHYTSAEIISKKEMMQFFTSTITGKMGGKTCLIGKITKARL